MAPLLDLLLHSSKVQIRIISLDVLILMNVLLEVTVTPMPRASINLVLLNVSAQLISLSEMVLQAVSPIQMTSSPQVHQALKALLQQPLLLQLLVAVVLPMISTALVKVCLVKLPMLPVMLPSHASVPHVVSNALTHLNHQMFLESTAKTLEKQRNKGGRMVTRNSVLEHQFHVVLDHLVDLPVDHPVVHPMVSVE